MQHLDEGTIHAWLDGALPAAESDAVAAHLAACAACAGRVAEERGMIAGASRIVSSLDVVRGNVIPENGAVARRSLWRRLHMTPARAAIAASVLVAVAAMLTFRNDTSQRAVQRRSLDNVASMRAVAASPPPQAAPAIAAAPPPAPPPAREAKTAELRVASRADSLVLDSARVAQRADSLVRRSPMRGVAGGIARSPAQLGAMTLTAPPVVGCYQLARDTTSAFKNLPDRFALRRGDDGQNVVRVVTPDGRVDSVIAGSGWQARAPELVVRFATPSPIVLTFTSASGTAQASSGAATRELSIRRADCRP